MDALVLILLAGVAVIVGYFSKTLEYALLFALALTTIALLLFFFA